MNVEDGLLIGATCPEVLKPLEVISGIKEKDPYAVRTTLRWRVIGVTSQGSDASTRKRFVLSQQLKK